MDSKNLIASLSTLRSKAAVVQLAKSLKGDDAGIKLLYKIIDQHPTELADKASWVARVWFEIHKVTDLPYLKLNLKALEKTTSDPVIRNLTGIFVDQGYPSSFNDKISTLCFKWLSNYSHAIAVHANALVLLSPILQKYPELKQEVIFLCEAHPQSDDATFRWRVERAINY